MISNTVPQPNPFCHKQRRWIALASCWPTSAKRVGRYTPTPQKAFCWLLPRAASPEGKGCRLDASGKEMAGKEKGEQNSTDSHPATHLG